MMSLTEAKLSTVTWRLYFYKLKAATDLIYGLLLMQIIAFLMSFNGTGGFGSSNGMLSITLKSYSANIVIGLTFLWIFVTAIVLTKQYKKMDFSLVRSRMSISLANIGFLVSVCFISSITSVLYDVLLRVIMYFTLNTHILGGRFNLPFSDLMLGLALTILYSLLIAAIGYFFGTLIKLHMVFAIIIPAVGISFARVNSAAFNQMSGFFTAETSPVIFILKTVIAAIILFGFSAFLENRMEVKE